MEEVFGNAYVRDRVCFYCGGRYQFSRLRGACRFLWHALPRPVPQFADIDQMAVYGAKNGEESTCIFAFDHGASYYSEVMNAAALAGNRRVFCIAYNLLAKLGRRRLDNNVIKSIFRGGDMEICKYVMDIISIGEYSMSGSTDDIANSWGSAVKGCVRGGHLELCKIVIARFISLVDKLRINRLADPSICSASMACNMYMAYGMYGDAAYIDMGEKLIKRFRLTGYFDKYEEISTGACIAGRVDEFMEVLRDHPETADSDLKRRYLWRKAGTPSFCQYLRNRFNPMPILLELQAQRHAVKTCNLAMLEWQLSNDIGLPGSVFSLIGDVEIHGSSIDICRLAAAHGANNWDDLLEASAKIGDLELCKFALSHISGEKGPLERMLITAFRWNHMGICRLALKAGASFNVLLREDVLPAAKYDHDKEALYRLRKSLFQWIKQQ